MRSETFWQATVDDLHREPGKAELVNGRIVRLPPSGGLHGYAATQIVLALTAYGRSTGRGHAVCDGVGFIVDLPKRRSFCPDAAFFRGPLSLEFVQGAPLFAIEVRSKSDYGPAAERAMAAKRAEYFAAGTLVVWDVDLVGRDTVRSHATTAPERPRVFRRGDDANAEPALPDWSMRVDDLFPTA